MLKLQRNFGQRIVIGDDVIIQVSGIRGQKVWLTVQAPKNVPIHLGPKALEMKANVNAVCDAYERLANLMPGIYAAVVQAKAYMTPDTKKGAEAQQMLHEVFREIRNLPESH